MNECMNGTRAHKAWKFINNKEYILSLFEVMRHVHVCMIEELHCGMTLKIYAIQRRVIQVIESGI